MNTDRRWLIEPVSADVEASLQRTRRLPDVCHMAVMPDVHLSHDVCVGTVVATRRLVYPAAVGGDIGCGILAVAFDCAADVLRDETSAARMFDVLRAAVPTNRHRRPADLPTHLAEAKLGATTLDTIKRRDGRVQFGTLGRGNHFLEFQSDEEGRLWLMVHSGSRAIGQAIRDHHVAVAGGRMTGLEGDAASAYLADAAWARAYADANRRAMADAASEAVRSLLSARRLYESLTTCDHNHVQSETHFGERFWVHRKGLASARVGEPGIIPGSMGTTSYLVEGRGDAESLQSSSHGAGASGLSREEARRRITAREFARRLRGVSFDSWNAASLREESPSAYKDIDAVMRAQRGLVRIVRTLSPVLSHKGR